MGSHGKPFISLNELPQNIMSAFLIEQIADAKALIRLPKVVKLLNENFAPENRSISQVSILKLVSFLASQEKLYLYERVGFYAIYPTIFKKYSKFKLLNQQAALQLFEKFTSSRL